MVETTAIPRKNPASSGRTIDGQAVIALSENAEIHILNDVGTRVWNLIDGRRCFEEIVALVAGQLAEEDYEGIPTNLAADVEEFLEVIAAKGMASLSGPES